MRNEKFYVAEANYSLFSIHFSLKISIFVPAN